jgi:allophanate hydrolase subunit 1
MAAPLVAHVMVIVCVSLLIVAGGVVGAGLNTGVSTVAGPAGGGAGAGQLKRNKTDNNNKLLIRIEKIVRFIQASLKIILYT